MILNDKNFEEEVLKSTVTVLVDFWAPWCSPCNALTPIIESLLTLHKVGKVNVEEEPDLSTRYNISAIPALLFFKNGEVVKKMVGFQSKEVLLKEFDRLKG